MTDQTTIISAFVHLASQFNEENEELSTAISKTYVENNWLTRENYWNALFDWKTSLTKENLENFAKKYTYAKHPMKVGIIMAGNIPMVGFHDLLSTLLSGHIAIIKPSSDDKYVMLYISKWLSSNGLLDKIEVVDRLNKIDAVIATGSNNSHRYFEQYFNNIPNLLRKNRKSMAVLSGDETDNDLDNLAIDVFQYFGLGCRNVSFILLPKSLDITRVLDHFMIHKDLENHNKYSNNYTYHRALLLMNSEQHLDTGFALCKERKNLLAPLACIHYAYYEKEDEVSTFIKNNEGNIQCVVGNYSQGKSVAFGQTQKPELQDFADNRDTMNFLESIAN